MPKDHPVESPGETASEPYERDRDLKRARKAIETGFPIATVLIDIYALHMNREWQPAAARYAIALVREACDDLGLPFDDRECVRAVDALDINLDDIRQRLDTKARSSLFHRACLVSTEGGA